MVGIDRVSVTRTLRAVERNVPLAQSAEHVAAGIEILASHRVALRVPADTVEYDAVAAAVVLQLAQQQPRASQAGGVCRRLKGASLGQDQAQRVHQPDDQQQPGYRERKKGKELAALSARPYTHT